MIRFAWALAAALLGLIVLAAGLEAGGYDAPAALGALWTGAFGSWYAFTSATLVRSVPLILIGLGIAIAFRAGSFNIGAEGQFYAGAIAATWVGLHLSGRPGAIAVSALLLASTLAGIFWVALPVWLKLRFGVIEVISTLLLNFVAEALVSLLVQGPLQEQAQVYPQSDPIAASARLPLLGPTRLHLGFILACVAAMVLWYLFAKTVWGFRLKAVGMGSRAAEVSGGVNSERVAAMALVCSGAMAGLAGGVEVGGVSYALFQNLSPGYGFTGIAVALLGGLHPAGVLLSGIFIGALEAGAGAMQREAGVPSVAVYLVEAVIIIVALLATAPKGGWVNARVIRRIGPAIRGVRS
ncbi:MAG TPA: ABC transporter permease [Gemmatimonadales bacterium]|nr:ABC transporter permease [Gemmatimonadales bacterium]